MLKTYSFFFLLFLFSTHSFSQDLLVTPKRIVFNNQSKLKKTLNLVNTGKDTVIYNISFLNYKMSSNGEFVQIFEEDSLHRFSDKYVRIFPRRVVLPPNDPQLISIQYRKKSDMITGEYRSHLYLRSELNNSALGSSDDKTPNQLGIQLVPVYGISIPIIIKYNEDDISVKITDSKLVKVENNYFVDFILNREGDFSFYGDIEVIYSNNNNEDVVSRINGIALYTDVSNRLFRFKLDNNDDYYYNNKSLSIRLWSNDLGHRKLITSSSINN